MRTITGSTGTTVSYSVAGSGPPLVLVHGAFSDHETNWAFVAPLMQQQFSVYAMARRGRGATDATVGHTLEDEARDVADVVRSIGVPVYLLGHSYGAHCALLAAAQQPDSVQKLVLYEPAWPHAIKPDALAALETLAAADAWEQFAFAFFANTLHVPTAELDARSRLRALASDCGRRASVAWRPSFDTRLRIRPGPLRGSRRTGAAADRIRESSGPLRYRCARRRPARRTDRHARGTGARGDDDGAGAVRAHHDAIPPGWRRSQQESRASGRLGAEWLVRPRSCTSVRTPRSGPAGSRSVSGSSCLIAPSAPSPGSR